MLAQWLIMGGNKDIALVSTSEKNAAATTTLVFTKPTGMGTGDTAVSFALCDDSAKTWTPASGFTERLDSVGAEVGTRVIDGSEAATLTCTISSSANIAGVIAVFRGGTYDTIGSVGTASGSPVAPSITMSVEGMALAIFWRDKGGITFSTPSGWEAVPGTAYAGLALSYAMFRKTVPAGVTGSVTSNASSGKDARGVLVGIKAS